MNWISEIPKELFADLFMEQNSILNSTREFKRPSSCGIFADMTIFMDYFHECFPILTFIITELKITDVLPPEVSTCGLLYTTTIGAWFGNLIDTPVLLFIIVICTLLVVIFDLFDQYLASRSWNQRNEVETTSKDVNPTQDLLTEMKKLIADGNMVTEIYNKKLADIIKILEVHNKHRANGNIVNENNQIGDLNMKIDSNNKKLADVSMMIESNNRQMVEIKPKLEKWMEYIEHF